MNDLTPKQRLIDLLQRTIPDDARGVEATFSFYSKRGPDLQAVTLKEQYAVNFTNVEITHDTFERHIFDNPRYAFTTRIF